MTTLNVKHLCPLNGEEQTFADYSSYFKNHIQGSNCYSYAMNHPMPNGHRPHKSVPGILSQKVDKIFHKNTDWQTCENAVSRLLADGRSVQKIYKLKTPLILRSQLKKPSRPGHRKIVMVVESDAEHKGTSTDFHFYAQNRSTLENLYREKRVHHTPKGIHVLKNPYQILGISPFVSDLQLRRLVQHEKNVSNSQYWNLLLSPQKRANLNLNLHENIIPSYMHDFFPNPFWILNAKKNTSSLLNRAKVLLHKHHNNPTKRKIIYQALKQANQIIKGQKILPSKSLPIALWSHKLGWGTVPLNTDGNGKLIFNPALASRKHSNRHTRTGKPFDYDLVCGNPGKAFDVKVGYGTSSI